MGRDSLGKSAREDDQTGDTKRGADGKPKKQKEKKEGPAHAHSRGGFHRFGQQEPTQLSYMSSNSYRSLPRATSSRVGRHRTMSEVERRNAREKGDWGETKKTLEIKEEKRVDEGETLQEGDSSSRDREMRPAALIGPLAETTLPGGTSLIS